MKPNHQCRVCGRWLEGEWNLTTDPDLQAALQRQMNQGHCDSCTPDPERPHQWRPTRLGITRILQTERLSIHRVNYLWWCAWCGRQTRQPDYPGGVCNQHRLAEITGRTYTVDTKPPLPGRPPNRTWHPTTTACTAAPNPTHDSTTAH